MTIAGPSTPAAARALPRSRVPNTALLGLGMVALLSQGLLPILLGYLGTAGRLSSAGLGEAAALESYALTFASAFAGLALAPKNLRAIGIASAIGLVTANLALPLLTSEAQILMARCLAGIVEGLLFWIALEAIARFDLSERAAAAMNTATLLSALGAANLINWLILPRFGIDGAFILLAAMSGAGILFSCLIPNALARASHRGEELVMPTTAGWLALLAIGLFNAAGMGFAIYLVPLAAQSGLSVSVAGEALTVLIGGQLAGSAIATLVAGRVKPFAMLMCSAAAYAVTWPFYAAHLSSSAFIFLAGSLGVITFFAFPFQFPFAADADPGSRTIVLAGPACMLGASTGPLFSAWTVDAFGLGGILYLGFALLLASVLLIVGLHVARAAATGRSAAMSK